MEQQVVLAPIRANRGNGKSLAPCATCKEEIDTTWSPESDVAGVFEIVLDEVRPFFICAASVNGCVDRLQNLRQGRNSIICK